MKRKCNNQTEGSRLRGDRIPGVVKMRPYKKPDFVCAAPGQKGVGSVLGGWQPDVPPSWLSLLQDKAEIGSRRGQWQVEKDAHHSVGLCWCPLQPTGSCSGFKSPLDQAEHQPCHCSSAWVCVTPCSPVWRDWHGCSQSCGSTCFPEAAEQRRTEAGRECDENWGNSEKRKMSCNRPCGAVLAVLGWATGMGEPEPSKR